MGYTKKEQNKKYSAIHFVRFLSHWSIWSASLPNAPELFVNTLYQLAHWTLDEWPELIWIIISVLQNRNHLYFSTAINMILIFHISFVCILHWTLKYTSRYCNVFCHIPVLLLFLLFSPAVNTAYQMPGICNRGVRVNNHFQWSIGTILCKSYNYHNKYQRKM